MLVVSAELKNVVILQPQDGIDNETINYYFKVNFQCCFDLTLFYILTFWSLLYCNWSVNNMDGFIIRKSVSI